MRLLLQQNSFEQLCINLANEALQQHFNVNIFQHEMEIYKSEGILIPDLSYNDNQDVLDLVIKKPKGLIPMLDEEGQVPKGSVDGFMSKFTKQNTSSVRLKYRQGAKDFIVVHYAGEVPYDPALFMIKNKDTLSQDLVDLMSASTVPLFAELFREKEADIAPSPMSSPKPGSLMKRQSSVLQTSGSNKLTVGTRFRIQLESLIANLNSTEPRYIRCIKPNQVKKPNIFEPILTNEQLTYSGVFEAVVIMQNGYPFRMSHLEFISRYHMLTIPAKSWNLLFNCGAQSPLNRDMCLTLTDSIARNVHETLMQCHVGKTMVFYRSEQHRILERERRIIWDSNLSKLQRYTRGSMVRFLMKQIKAAAAICSHCIDARDVDQLAAAKDKLIFSCSKLNRITDLNIFEDLQSLSKRYYDVAVLQQHAEVGIKTILDKKNINKDGLLHLFDELEGLVIQAKTIDFHEIFRGREIKIHWSLNADFVVADKELESLRIIKSIKENLESGIINMDEVLLKEWIEKLAHFRSAGLVERNYCVEEETKARSAIEIAQKQFQDFIGSAYNAISEGQFKFSIIEPGSVDGEINIAINVDTKPLLTFLDKNKKLFKSNNSVQVRHTLILCEKLCDLRAIASEAPVEYEQIWNHLQIWRRYFESSPSSERVSTETNKAVNSRSGSVRRRSVTSGADRSKADELNSAEEFMVPWIADIASPISAEIQTVIICCLEAVQFKQLRKEIETNCIPAEVIHESVHLSLDSLNHLLNSLASYEHYFSAAQVKKMYDAKERWYLRRGVCSRNTSFLLNALNGSTKYPLPKTDPEYKSATLFYEFYMCEQNLLAGLTEDGPSLICGYEAFSTIRVQKIKSALQMAKMLYIKPAATNVSTHTGSNWEKLLLVCDRIAEIRELILSKRYSEAVTVINQSIESEIWKIAATNFIQEQTICHMSSSKIFSSIVETVESDPSLITVPSGKSILPKYFSTQVADFSADESTSEDLGNSISPLTVSLYEMFRLKDQILHQQGLDLIYAALSAGGLEGNVGELDNSNLLHEPLKKAITQAAGVMLHSEDSISLFSCASGILTLRINAKNSKWDQILKFMNLLFFANSPTNSSLTYGSALKLIHPRCRDEYSVFYEEAMDLQTREKLLKVCESGKLNLDANTGDLIVDFASTDKLLEALNFAEERSEKSIECIHLYNSVKLLYCMRSLVINNRWEKILSDDFPTELLLNCSISSTLTELRDRLLQLKSVTNEESFTKSIRSRAIYYLDLLKNAGVTSSTDCTQSYPNLQNIRQILSNPTKTVDTFLTSNSALISSRAADIHDPALPLSDLFVYSMHYGYHEAVADEVENILSSFRERCCKLCLYLAASIDCVQGSVDTLDTSTADVNLLSKMLEYSHFVSNSRTASVLMNRYCQVSSILLNIRLAVSGTENGVDLLSYFTPEQLKKYVDSVEGLDFPSAEINLVVNHISDSRSIAQLIDAIHLGCKCYYLIFVTALFDVEVLFNFRSANFEG